MHRRIRMLTGLQPQRAGEGDHRAVVGAQGRAREADPAAAALGSLLQARAQALVCAHAAGHHQGVAAGRVQRAQALDGEGVHHRVFEAARDVRPGGVGLVAGPPGQQHLGLEPTETEIQAGPVGHRPRELIAPRRAGFGQGGQLRAARVRQAHHLGGLVEGFAGRIVQRLAQHLVAAQRLHRHQLGMPAGYQQGHERRLRRVVFHQRRQQVAFHMVHADRRHIQCPGQRARHAGTDQQCADQPRPRGVGHTIQFVDAQPGLAQGLADQRQQLAHMVAAGKLRYHAAVFGMQRDLAVDRMRAQRRHAG